MPINSQQLQQTYTLQKYHLKSFSTKNFTRALIIKQKKNKELTMIYCLPEREISAFADDIFFFVAQINTGNSINFAK